MPYSFIKWIDVNQRKPEPHQTILFCCPDQITLQGFYSSEEGLFIGYLWGQKRNDVTHWAENPVSVSNQTEITAIYEDTRNLETHQG